MDFLCRAADALFADFADVLVSGLVGFTLFVRFFRQLHHDKFTVASILSIQLHDSMSGGGGAREEVEDDVIFFCCMVNKAPYHFYWLYRIKSIIWQKCFEFALCTFRCSYFFRKKSPERLRRFIPFIFWTHFYNCFSIFDIQISCLPVFGNLVLTKLPLFPRRRRNSGNSIRNIKNHAFPTANAIGIHDLDRIFTIYSSIILFRIFFFSKLD